MAAEPMLTRRSAFRLTAGALVAGWALPTVASAADAMPAWTPKALTADQARTLTAAAETIIPATDTPGATALGVPQFVDRALGDWCEPGDAARLRAGLDQLDAEARAAHGAGFAALPAEQQTAMLSALDAEARATSGPHFFRQLKDLVTVGYFTSEVGATKVLRYDPVPGAYHGCVPLKDIGRAWATA
jgi:hypothetical protein